MGWLAARRARRREDALRRERVRWGAQHLGWSDWRAGIDFGRDTPHVGLFSADQINAGGSLAKEDLLKLRRDIEENFYFDGKDRYPVIPFSSPPRMKDMGLPAGWKLEETTGNFRHENGAVVSGQAMADAIDKRGLLLYAAANPSSPVARGFVQYGLNNMTGSTGVPILADGTVPPARNQGSRRPMTNVEKLRRRVEEVCAVGRAA